MAASDRTHHRLDDVHLGFGVLVDRAAAEAACAVDAAADRAWLAAHPQKRERVPLASIREIIAHGLPAGATVVVSRGPVGSQIRVFLHPRS